MQQTSMVFPKTFLYQFGSLSHFVQEIFFEGIDYFLLQEVCSKTNRFIQQYSLYLQQSMQAILKIFLISVYLLILSPSASAIISNGQQPQNNPSAPLSPDTKPLSIVDVELLISITGTQPLLYEIYSDTFTLKLKLAGTLMLIEMIDIENGVLYQKLYSEDDIGIVIDTIFFDMVDLYAIFVPPTILKAKQTNRTLNQDQLQEIQKEKSDSKLRRYVFGTFIKNDRSYYAVNPGGNLTVAVPFQRRRGEKAENVTSYLQLETVRVLNEQQHLAISLSNLRRQAYDQVDALNSVVKYSQDIILALQQRSRDVFGLRGRIQDLNSQIDRIQKTKLPLDLSSSYSHYFNVIQNKISFLSNQVWRQGLIKEIIPKDKVYVFRIRIVQTQRSQIAVGVVDRSRALQVFDSCGSEYAVCYQGSNGRKYPSFEIQGNGFTQNETLEVRVDLAAGRVTWSVDNEVRATQQLPILQENLPFVPFFMMNNKHDCIQWLGGR